MKRLVMLTAAGLALAGCATPPAYVPFDNSTTVSLSKDEVWSNLVEYFATSNISIKTIEKDSGIIYAERMLAGAYEIGSVASCGANFMAPSMGATADLNVFVREQTGGTRITVTTNFREMRSNAMANGQMFTAQCNSLGVMEAGILRAAAGRP